MKTNFMMAAIIVILSLVSNQGFAQYFNMDKLLYQDYSNYYHRVISYPNPANNVVTFQNLSENTTITFYNTLGQLVKKVYVATNENVVIDVSDLANGKYYLEIRNKNKKVRDVTYLQVTR